MRTSSFTQTENSLIQVAYTIKKVTIKHEKIEIIKLLIQTRMIDNPMRGLSFDQVCLRASVTIQ